MKKSNRVVAQFCAGYLEVGKLVTVGGRDWLVIHRELVKTPGGGYVHAYLANRIQRNGPR